MNLLFIIDPIDLLPNNDSSLFMMEKSLGMGYSVYFSLSRDFHLIENGVSVQCRRVSTVKGRDVVYDKCAETYNIDHFKRILVRKEPPFDTDYLHLTLLLQYAQKKKQVVVYNDPEHLQQINEKMAIFYFPHDIAPTIVSADKTVLFHFLNQYKTVIAKKLDSMGGNAVFKISDADENQLLLIETLTKKYEEQIMLQKFIPEIQETGDIRVLIVHGQTVPFGLRRFPSAKSFRANLAAGGYGTIAPLSEKEKKISEKVSRFFKDKPIGLVGLDIINNQLNEINITCPSCIKQIEESTDCEFKITESFLRADAHQ